MNLNESINQELQIPETSKLASLSALNGNPVSSISAEDKKELINECRNFIFAVVSRECITLPEFLYFKKVFIAYEACISKTSRVVARQFKKEWQYYEDTQGNLGVLVNQGENADTQLCIIDDGHRKSVINRVVEKDPSSIWESILPEYRRSKSG